MNPIPRLHANGSHRSDPTTVLSYVLAAVVGLAVAFYCIPIRTMIGRLPAGTLSPFAALPSHEVIGAVIKRQDALQHLTGQLFFLHEPWHWPLFKATQLGGGVSIALTDSIPWVVFLQKLLHPVLPWVQQSVGPYLTLAVVMQPIAAVFALRAAGCLSPLAALAISVLAGTAPAMLWEPSCEALDGHWLVLLAIGLYFLAVRSACGPARHSFAQPVLLLNGLGILALGIHPYIDLMVLAFVAAVPVTLLARGRYRSAVSACGVMLGSLVLLKGEALLLDLDTALPVPANQYIPFFYQLIADPLLRYFPKGIRDQGGFFVALSPVYAGAGVLLLAMLSGLGLVTKAHGRRMLALGRRHPGLICASLGLLLIGLYAHAIAVMLRGGPFAYLGNVIGQFRGGSRLYYPVFYLSLIAAVKFVPGRRVRDRFAVLCLCCCLQLWDVAEILQQTRWQLAWNLVPMTDAELRLDALLQGAKTLVLRPTIACEPDRQFSYPAMIYMAARRNVAVDQVVLARSVADARCSPGDEGPNAGIPFQSPSRHGDVVTVLRGQY